MGLDGGAVGEVSCLVAGPADDRVSQINGQTGVACTLAS